MDTQLIPVMEQFYTLQGEGRYTGHAAYFIRLGGCDVGCVWCDVKESWDMDSHPKQSVDSLVSAVVESGARIAVITGGEPMMHDCGPLTAGLQEAGIRTHVETAGVHPLTGTWDWITFSPKKFKKPLDLYFDKADELKVVVFNKHDFAWAEEHAIRVGEDCEKYLQPEWDRRDQVVPMMLNYIREHPEWILSQQTHKDLGIP